MNTPDTTSSGGLLARAFAENTIAPIEWVDVELDGLRITVASDAVSAVVDDELLRLPVSYQEQVEICRANDWVSPWLELCAAMVKQAKRKPPSKGQVRDGHPEDQVAMKTLGFTRTFSRRLDALFAKLPPGLAAGPWKWWILHQLLAVRGAVNHGFYGEVTPGVPVQLAGTAHDPKHWDYSQLFQPVKRWAVDIASGLRVDLLTYLASHGVPERFLEPYRGSPAAAVLEAPAAPERLPLLAKGDKGPEVGRLQEALNAAGASPALKVDHDFGKKTGAAVREFQKARGLVVDELVGAGTWAALLGHPVQVKPAGKEPRAPACVRALADASALAPDRNRASDGIMGDAAHQLTPSDHNLGTAVDITHDPAAGCDGSVLAELALTDDRVTYVIWNRRICSRARIAEGWRPYTGSNPHTHHVHISVDAAKRADARPWPWAPSCGGASAASRAREHVDDLVRR
jgi:hypothetical protein